MGLSEQMRQRGGRADGRRQVGTEAVGQCVYRLGTRVEGVSG